MTDLHEVLDLDTDGKLNYLVAKTYEIENRLDIIENNHLHHIELGMNEVKKRLYLISAVILSVLTGQNLVM
tara:strand:+ start:10269 stop:10481 length:213 start_codon:yes stop_codon:yes gene_type:complete